MDIEVVGLGLSSLDYLGIVPDLPGFDQVMDITSFSIQGGGPVAQALVTLSRLGAKTSYIGACGDDVAGMEMRKALVSEGVLIEHFAVLPGVSSTQCLIFIHEPTGKRSIGVYKGPADAIDLETLNLDVIRSARILHLDGYSPKAALIAAETARQAGVIVSLDAAPQTPELVELVRRSDLVIVGEPAACAATAQAAASDAARAIALLGPRTVVITQGEHGSLTFQQGELFTTPSFTVPVVDTTGAGDAFHGGYLYGLLRGWNAERTAQFANATAALKCRKLGGRAGIPTLQEVEGFLDHYQAPPRELPTEALLGGNHDRH